jgi:hypothetical protein
MNYVKRGKLRINNNNIYENYVDKDIYNNNKNYIKYFENKKSDIDFQTLIKDNLKMSTIYNKKNSYLKNINENEKKKIKNFIMGNEEYLKYYILYIT